MKKYLGPILSFRKKNEDKWHVSCLFVTDEKPGRLKYDVGDERESEPILLHVYKGNKVWRYDMEVLLGSEEKKVTYKVADISSDSWNFTAPAKDSIPKSAYASCNGFSHAKEAKKIPDKNAMWKDMAHKHKAGSYHLLLMGGDQVYGDSLWEMAPEVKKWAEKKNKERISAKFTPTMAKQIEGFYFNLYCDRWSQPEMQNIFSSVPAIMMWDDHDIFDGWGSHKEEEQNCEVFKGIFSIAKNHFRVFQQQLEENEKHPSSIESDGFSIGFKLGKLALIAFDMRSERTNEQVISPNTWGKLYKWLEGLEDTVKHLYVLSSIPVVHPDFSMIEDILGICPGQQGLEDDLRDHWHSRSHRGERLRLIHRLLGISEQKNNRVTILSGDVHVAALGVINSIRTNASKTRSHIINQLTSSGIVHPAPPAVVLLALKILGAKIEDVDQGITTQLTNFPGSNHSFIGARNWLSLEPDSRNRIWANWFVEGETDKAPYTKVIHPVDFEQ